MDEAGCDAWNPGLSSSIPSALQAEVTLFRAESSTVDYRTARELADFCGLKPTALIAFRIERLLIHDLLVRVTSDLSVPDGPNYEDLGISLRSMVHTIYSDYVTPEIEQFKQSFGSARKACEETIRSELNERLFATTKKAQSAK